MVHDRESSFGPKLTMPMNFYCLMLSLTDKQKRLSTFVLFELSPLFVKIVYSDEIS